MDNDTLTTLFAVCAAQSACLAALVGVLVKRRIDWKKKRRKRRARRWWIRPINLEREGFGEFTTLFHQIKNTDHEQFFLFTRMNIAQFNELERLVTPFLEKRSIRKPISVQERLALTLRFLAHGGDLQTLAWGFRIGKSTANKIVTETCAAIWAALAPKYLKKPTKADWIKIAEGYEKQWNFPHCLGSIDGKHIKVEAPPNSGSIYFNYKGYKSVVMMAAVDSEYKFIWVASGAFGSESDGGVFAKSAFGQALCSGALDLPDPQYYPGTVSPVPYMFIADEAFPLKENLMRPYPGKGGKEKLSYEKTIFNYRLSRARRTVENAFGILAQRWRIFRKEIVASPETVNKFVMACACLHNFLFDEEFRKIPGQTSDYCPRNFVNLETDIAFVEELEWRRKVLADGALEAIGRVGSNNSDDSTKRLRDSLARYFCTTGAVPWQDAAVNIGK